VAVAAAALATGGIPRALAQEDAGSDELELFELNDALLTQTKVASEKAQEVRQAPGVITVIDSAQIRDSGARDLVDVLLMVPGFFFGVDVEGTVGVGFRGNWGHEGKVLLLLDGQEMNEGMYSTLQFGNHYPVDQIERVEVVRGPGSAIYGGYAELAVINVITRGANELKGARATASYGQGTHGYLRRNLSAQVGQVFEKYPGLSASLSVFAGQGMRSTGTYTGIYDEQYPMAQASNLDPLQLNGALTYKGFSLRLLYDNYVERTQDAYDVILTEPERMGFRSMFADASYAWKVTDKLTITPRLNYRRQDPWNTPNPESDGYYDKMAERFRARITASYDATADVNLVAGFDGYIEHAALNNDALGGFQAAFSNGGTSVHYQDAAGFAEVTWNNPIVNVVAGARLEHHSQFGDSFVPRLALTKVVGAFHAKALASRAFRAPGIENFSLNPDIKPESTTVFELEAGYQLSRALYIGANAFDMTVSDPIIYFYDAETDEEGYLNATRTGSRGLEGELRWQGGFGYVNLGYSFYTAGGKNEVDTYTVPGHGNAMLGAPNHRLSVTGHFKLWRSLSFNPTATFMSARYGYGSSDADGNPVLAEYGATALLNAYVQYKDAGAKGLDVGVGVYNLLGSSFGFVQPYNAGHAPLPALGREFLVKLSYQLPL
jgi:outer membrane receptor for ferrienterochelin and colicin